jgi:hypothetical protein
MNQVILVLEKSFDREYQLKLCGRLFADDIHYFKQRQRMSV